MIQHSRRAGISYCLAVVVLLAGCHRDFDPVPGRVTSEETQLYETWLWDHKQHSPKTVIEVFSLTSPVPPNNIASNASGDVLKLVRDRLRRDGIPADAFTRLAELGDARYPVPAFLGSHLAEYLDEHSTVDVNCTDGDVHRIQFSRVAFSRDRKMALFYVLYVHCSHGMIGGGGGSYVLASKETNGWSFKNVGPRTFI